MGFWERTPVRILFFCLITVGLGLSGTALVYGLSLNTAAHDFGDVDCGTSPTYTVTITNDEAGAVDIGGIKIKGEDAGLFGIINDTCSNQTIAVAGTCTVDVEFEPDCPGLKTANLYIPNDGDTSPALELPDVWGTAYPAITWIKDGQIEWDAVEGEWVGDPALPGRVIYIYGHGFCNVRWVKLNKKKFKLDSGRIHYWTDEQVQFELPLYRTWVSGTNVSKKVRVGVRAPGEGIFKTEPTIIQIQKP